jgi:ribosomal protein S12 methylthiotransferase
LMETQRDISLATNQALVGRTLDVLVDGPSEQDDRVLCGRTAAQAPDVDGQVFLDATEDDVKAGQIRSVRITRATDYDLVGQVVA